MNCNVIIVAVAHSEVLPVSVSTLQFHRERRVFWPPTTYYDPIPLPEAWLSMMLSKNFSSQATTMRLSTMKSTQEDLKDVRDIVVFRKYAEFIARIFDKEKIGMDGTTQTWNVLESLIDTLRDDISYGSEGEKQKLQPLLDAIEMLKIDDVVPDRISLEELIPRVFTYLQKDKHEIEDHKKSKKTFDPAKIAEADEEENEQEEDDLADDPDPVVENKEPSDVVIDPRKSKRSNRLTSILNELSLRPKQQPPKTPLQRGFSSENMNLDGLCSGASIIEETASILRKNRRLLIVLSIFEDVSKQSDVMDIAELRQYLTAEKEKLVKVLQLVEARKMKMPPVSYNYEMSLTAKFSLLKGVICCNMLSSSTRLNILFKEYDSTGVAIISQIGFVATCEEMFRSMAIFGTLHTFDDAVRKLIAISEREYSNPDDDTEAGKLHTVLKLCCGKHGVGEFLLPDLCCVACEVCIYRKGGFAS